MVSVKAEQAQTRLLALANVARAAADQADAADDDLRVVVFRDIEQTCRYLVCAAYQGWPGWNRHDRAASEAAQQQAALWGLSPPTATAPTCWPRPPTPKWVSS
ncbi:hypothetical protein [Streptomyces sp. NPDC056821]|uniref:hypothetical protein n=1 Tax=unclassified Streptomyces TaxID=2593676 RepID=UPI0036938B18